jgi:Zn-dependent M28 family amino/carboxypeptidase
MKKITRIFVSILLLLVTVNIVLWSVISQPTGQKNGASGETVSAEKLKTHVVMLSQTFHPRDWTHPENLKRCADYIATHFTNAGAVVESQQIEFRGKTYQNIIGRFNKGQGPRVIVGAHYDSCGETPGADDNASGVAALIELAYLLGRVPSAVDVELVAYVNEEPPFYRTELMGSAIHAKRVKKEEVKGVIVLEMVGYFKDESGSQQYPSGLLQLWYPGKGNFIGVVGTSNQGAWIKRIKAGMKGATDLPVYSIRAPASVPGVDFSDHASYWPYNIPAVMVTDTAFFRNQAYHTLEDTADSLDYARMAKVVVSVSAAVRTL